MSRYAYQLILMAIFVSAAGAQQSISSTPGERVRIVRARADTVPRFSSHGEMGRQVEGTLVSMERDSIVIQEHGASLPLSFPLSAVDHVDVAAGKNRGKGAAKGALIGGLTLGVAGAVAGASAGTGGPYNFNPGPVLGVETAGFGAVLGALIGFAVGSQGWNRVGTPAHVAIAPLRGGGARIGLSMQF